MGADHGRLSPDLAAVAASFKGRRCLVVGDALLDVFENGRAVRLAPDAPAPVVQDVERSSSPGGGANVAANLASLGAEVSLVAAIGEDEPGDELLAALTAAGVGVDGVLRVPGRATVAKRRIQAGGTTLARLDSGDTTPLAADAAREVARRAGARAEDAEVLVVSDYSCGTVGGPVAEALRGHPLAVLDSKEPLRLRWEGLAAATPNHMEAQKALGIPPEVDPGLVDAGAVGEALRERLGARLVALTLAEAGVVLVEESGARTTVPGRAVPDAQPNGAGDSFLSAFALALCCGAAPGAAARLGVEAATLAVALPGTTPVGLAELLGRLEGTEQQTSQGTGESLEADLVRVRQAGGRVVFCRAYHGIASPEGLRMLRGARSLGDLLVVGLGPGERSEVLEEFLGELRCVDHVVPFEDQEALRELVRRVSPEVCVLDGGPGEGSLARLVEVCGGKVVPMARLNGGAGVVGTNGRSGGQLDPALPGARG
jgi:D-beta-D-heptose 7-phosphate kinase/D-beta-D-heptose 1-phosphate adenosyltransferase